MKKSDELFSLIKALSKNEKGYFKKYASKHVLKNGNNYILLFNTIDKINEYDEKKIKLKLGIDSSNNFPSDKNYLHKLIIRSLNEYHHDNSIDRALRDMLNSVEILYGKALYSQCEKILDKAESLAEIHEKFLLHLEIIDWKLHISITQAKVEVLQNHLKNNNKKRKILIDKYNNLNEYRTIESNLFYLTKTYGYPRTKSEAQRYEKAIDTPLLKNAKEALGFWATFHYHNIFNFYYDVIRDHQKLYECRKQLIDFAESKPEMINDNQIRYLVALNNLLNIQDELGKDDEVAFTLKKLRSIKSKAADIQMRIFTYTYTIEFTRLIIRGDFEKCILLRPTVEEGLKKFERKINREYILALRYNLFYAYFGVGNFNESLKWVNQILNDRYIELRKDIYAFVRIMYLILHYELGNADLLSYAIQSAKRFFKKEERFFQFEAIMLNFIENASNTNSKQDTIHQFEGLKSTLLTLKSDNHESQVMEYFDFDAWVDSKITKTPFSTIVQKRM